MILRKALLFVLAIAIVGILTIVTNSPTTVLAHKDKVVDQTIELTLSDFFYQAKGAAKNAPITVKAGQLVRFVLTNPSKLVHEMHIGRKANTKDQLYDESLDDMYDSVWLNPGQSAELWVKIPDKPGEWELGCFHEEHYNAGMKTKLIIQPKS
ncbi:multicopper oxidase domain-containing protein [Candidatus Acetothermia bacterium]|nr:multicopper oxidase domain-containing protein [Candidatus Acetothermia bacterium]MBI3459373.1 multicopper oxidase domain-containing protein [Candidatus Acetothermia bacterium]